jgi:hypothetical protein
MQDSNLISAARGRYSAMIASILIVISQIGQLSIAQEHIKIISEGLAQAIVSFGDVITCLSGAWAAGASWWSKHRSKKAPAVTSGTPGLTGASGCAVNMWPILAMAVICSFLLLFPAIFNACAVNQTDSRARLASAKIAARHAGKYVWANNPKLAHHVALSYAAIEKAEGESYQESIKAILAQMLEDQGVRDSYELLADARDIADLLRIDLPSSPQGVTLDWIKQFDINGVRAVAEAFLEGIPAPSGG